MMLASSRTGARQQTGGDDDDRGFAIDERRTVSAQPKEVGIADAASIDLGLAFFEPGDDQRLPVADNGLLIKHLLAGIGQLKIAE